MKARRQTSGSAKRKRRATTVVVHPDMNVSEIVALHEDAEKILAAYGLHCVGCAYNQLETLREGAESHGLTDDDLGNLMTDLADAIASAPAKPTTLTITEPAARALLTIAREQAKEGWKLRVTSDATGGFCMEFEEEEKEGDHTFAHANVPELVLIAAQDTLARIGGSTIDHREGRFKLDVAVSEKCGCEAGSCTKCESARSTKGGK